MVRTAAVLSIVKVEVSGEGGKCELIDKMANPLLRFVDAQRTRTDFLSDTASSKNCSVIWCTRSDFFGVIVL